MKLHSNAHFDQNWAIDLSYKQFGDLEAPPVIILHGLLGSSRNWTRIGQELAQDYCVYALDQRNHGTSPHTQNMNYSVLTEDLLRWMDAQRIETPHLIGHSMGGKAAMHFACTHSDALKSLTVVDIAPKPYDPHHRAEFEAMQALDLAHIKNRRDAEMALEETIDDWALRQFILTNLVRDTEGNFTWQVNLPLLASTLPELSQNPLPPQAEYLGPTLFIRGGKSNFMVDADMQTILKHFPHAEIKRLDAAGHNPHMDARDAFLASIRNFIG